MARGIDEVEALRDALEGVAWRHPDPEPDYFLPVVATLPGVLRPHVVHVERPGRPLVVVGRLEEIELEAKLGYVTVYSQRVRCLTVVHDGVAGAETSEDSALVLEILQGSLAAREADVLRFLGLPTDSALYRAAANAPRWACRDHGAAAQPHWRVAVPDSIDDFLSARSRNTRQNVRRYGKRFEKEYGGRFAVRRFGAGLDCDLERLCADLETVAIKTYQRKLGVGYTGNILQREIMKLGLERDRYLAWVLDIDGVPSAFWDGTIQSGTFFIGSPGYDPAYGRNHIGTWLQMRMMEDLCARDAVRSLDYGMGDAQYKRSFGDECWTDSILHVFAETPRGLRANAARSAAVGVNRAARRALSGTGLERRIKREWRRRAPAAEDQAHSSSRR